MIHVCENHLQVTDQESSCLTESLSIADALFLISSDQEEEEGKKPQTKKIKR